MALGNTVPVSSSDVGALSGNSITWPANANAKGVSFPGRSNTPNGRAISILFRYKPSYTGAPANATSLISLETGAGRLCGLEFQHLAASGNLICLARNEVGTTVMNSASFGAWSPTAGTWYDIVFTWDGTASASSASIYIDAVLLGAVTPTGAYTASWTNQYFSEINLGAGQLAGSMNASSVDEVVVWGNVIDPTAVILDAGSGSLNGALRVSLVTAAAFNGSTYTDPGIANVKSGTAYTYAGSSLTGTLATTGGGGIQFGGPSPMGRN